MKKRLEIIALIGLVGLLAGCASQMVNEEGDDWSWYGRLVDWVSPWHGSDAELTEESPSENDGPPSPDLSYGDFLWKPISESDGNLVVLLPFQLTGNVVRDQVAICRNEDGTDVIEVGVFSGATHNGGREHFRYSKPGSAYGKEVYIHAALMDGGEKSWFIPDGSNRVE